MRKALIYLFSLIFIIQSPLFSYSTNPKNFINELVSDAINKLADKNISMEQKSAFIEKVALENVDINARFIYAR